MIILDTGKLSKNKPKDSAVLNNFMSESEMQESTVSANPLTIENNWKEKINTQMATLVGFGIGDYYKFSLKTKLNPKKVIDLNMKLDRIENSQMENRDMFNKTNDFDGKTTDVEGSVTEKSISKKTFHPRHSKKSASMKNFQFSVNDKKIASFDNKDYRIFSKKNIRPRTGVFDRLLTAKK